MQATKSTENIVIQSKFQIFIFAFTTSTSQFNSVSVDILTDDMEQNEASALFQLKKAAKYI